MKSFVSFQTEITSIIHCQCLAIDFRGHGDTRTTDDDDLSAETMATDIANVLAKLYEDVAAPSFLLMGHSMVRVQIRLKINSTMSFFPRAVQSLFILVTCTLFQPW